MTERDRPTDLPQPDGPGDGGEDRTGDPSVDEPTAPVLDPDEGLSDDKRPGAGRD
ncbi:MAG TPA: hypothetical protein VE975_06325 [Actinomycetota bacterium]|nr:hypothetical protein [Actinomycetota bacterium]